jgi:hypothetical protein
MGHVKSLTILALILARRPGLSPLFTCSESMLVASVLRKLVPQVVLGIYWLGEEFERCEEFPVAVGAGSHRRGLPHVLQNDELAIDGKHGSSYAKAGRKLP